MNSEKTKKFNKKMLIVLIILIAILFGLIVTINNSNSEETSIPIENNYSYDNLQKVFLEITPDTTPDDVLKFAQQYNLCYSEKQYFTSKSICYKLAYSDDIAKFKYPETGDHIEFDFDMSDNNRLKNAEYFNNNAYCYGDISSAVLYVSGGYWDFKDGSMDGDYSGYYGHKQDLKNDDGIIIKYTNGTSKQTDYYTFDSSKSVINCIIDNSEKYISSNKNNKK